MNARLQIHRADLHQTRVVPDPDATRPLADGEMRLAIDHFALTANNITYAAFGVQLRYWEFFPTGDAAWGCLPVWGFAEVAESRAEGVAVGERVYGYLPFGTHLVVEAAKVTPQGFFDGAAHRRELSPVYNQLLFCRSDPGYGREQEAQQAILRPLFFTSFLIDDFLAESGFFGAAQVLLSSASSKTAYGLAHCLASRRNTPGAPRITGLTSPANLEFIRALHLYDEVVPYDAVQGLDPRTPTVYVDFAGNAALRRRVHEHFEGTLAYSASIGGTHWDHIGSGGGLPGPKPTLFFAPAQVKKRSAPPPEGWGTAGLMTRIGQAWAGFMRRVAEPSVMSVRSLKGPEAATAAYLSLLEGRSDPHEGLMVAMR